MPRSTKRKAMRPRKGKKSKRSLRKARKSGVRSTGPGQFRVLNYEKNPIVSFTKTAKFDVNLVNAITGLNTSQQFIGGALANSMPDWSVITSLYNRYRMDAVTYTFQWVDNQSVPGTDLSTVRAPKMYIRYNYDSNLNIGNVITKLQELDNVQVFTFTPEKTSFSYTYYPRVIEPVYLSSVATGYKVGKKQFIDVQYGGVPHYGLIFDIDYLATGTNMLYDITWKTSFKYSA